MIKSLKQMVEALPQPLELQEEPESKYTILKNIGCMSTYREPRDRRITTKNHTCIEIKSLVKLLYGNRAAAFVMFCCIDNSHGGKIKATRDRDMTTADLVKMTSMSKKTVLAALKKLDDLGLVRGYRDPEDNRRVHYIVNPLYWIDVTKGRRIDWIDWLVFSNELAPFLDEETIKNLNNMAYTQWIKNYGR